MWPDGLYASMPIPEYIGPEGYCDQEFLARAWCNLKFTWWPQRCYASKKWLWFTRAYRADYVITGPGEPAVWTRWYSLEEMLMAKLKGYTK